MSTPVAYSDLVAAQGRIGADILHTPLLESRALNERLGHRVLFKPECLQRTGSFKIRGALNVLHQLNARQRRAGVVAFSSGNHGQGVACAARQLGVRATVIMPDDAPAIKRRNVEKMGAELILYHRTTQKREEIARDMLAGSEQVLIKPFDDPRIIAGQGTIGLEILAEIKRRKLPPVDRVIAPVGGGGLIAGICLAFQQDSPDTDILGAEPKDYDDTWRSLQSGRRETNPTRPPTSICDSLMTEQPGAVTFAITAHALTDVIRISDDRVRAAIRTAADDLKTVVEPGGATGLAALELMSKDCPPESLSVVVLSGGNIDHGLLTRILSES